MRLPGAVSRRPLVQRSDAAGIRSGARAAYGWGDQRWTLERVPTVIERPSRISCSVAGLWRLLHRHGWTRQSPTRRALERDEALSYAPDPGCRRFGAVRGPRHSQFRRPRAALRHLTAGGQPGKRGPGCTQFETISKPPPTRPLAYHGRRITCRAAGLSGRGCRARRPSRPSHRCGRRPPPNRSQQRVREGQPQP